MGLFTGMLLYCIWKVVMEVTNKRYSSNWPSLYRRGQESFSFVIISEFLRFRLWDWKVASVYVPLIHYSNCSSYSLTRTSSLQRHTVYYWPRNLGMISMEIDVYLNDLAIALAFSYCPFLIVCGVSRIYLDALPHSCNSLASLGPSEPWPQLNLLPLK